MKNFFFGCLLLCALTIQQASAQTNYQVELIVFSRDGSDADSEEQLRSDNLRYPEKIVTLQVGDGSGAAYQLLPAGDLQLNKEAGVIAQRKNMHVLLHQAWRAPLDSPSRATNVFISGGRQFGNHHELEGFITLSAEHFLRLETQLWLSRFTANAATPNDPIVLPTPPDAIATGADAANNFAVSQLNLLREQRRMRSGELHYFDHPRLGLLVLVTPVTAAP